MDEGSVIGAANVSAEEQMRRAPNVATKGQQSKGDDERLACSPEALCSNSASEGLHGQLSGHFLRTSARVVNS